MERENAGTPDLLVDMASAAAFPGLYHTRGTLVITVATTCMAY